MAHIWGDRVRESSTTTGTGNMTLAGTSTGFRTFASVCANGDSFYYSIVMGASWEVGLGQFVSATPALQRVTVFASSNAGALVNFGAGTKDIWIDAPALALSLGASAAQGVISDSPSASQNNYSPAGFTSDSTSVLRITPTNSILITGLAARKDGTRIRIVNATGSKTSGARLIIFPHFSSSSSAGNRIAFHDQCARFLPADQSIELWYDGASALWRECHVTSFINQFSTWYSDNLYDTGAVFGSGGSAGFDSYLSGDATQNPLETLVIETGTTSAAAFAGIGSNSVLPISPAEGDLLFLSRVAVHTLSSGSERFRATIGLSNTIFSAGEASLDQVAWGYREETSPNWLICTSKDGTATRTSSGVAVNTNYAYLGFYINGNWTNVDFFISSENRVFNFAGSLTTNFPVAADKMDWGAKIEKTIGTGNRAVSIDLMGFSYNPTRGA